MSAGVDTGSLVEAADRVRHATRQLIGAAERGDVDEIHSRIDERSVAMRRLERMLLDDPPDAVEQQRLKTELALQADDAETALRRLMEGARQELQALSRGARVLRGYGSTADRSSALDRAG